MMGLVDVVRDLRQRVSDLERRQRDMSRTGVVVEVDAGAGRARVMLRDGEVPLITDWLAWEEVACGAMRTHMPPSVGQQVRLQSETGDLQDATIQGSLPSTQYARASGGAGYVLAKVGAAAIEISAAGDEITLRVGPSVLRLAGAGITLDAPRIDLN